VPRLFVQKKMQFPAITVFDDGVEPRAAAAHEHARAGSHSWWQRLHGRRRQWFAGFTIVDRICGHSSARQDAAPGEWQCACRADGVVVRSG
jgi:hypothetical protein